jgi:hypothetical protein
MQIFNIKEYRENKQTRTGLFDSLGARIMRQWQKIEFLINKYTIMSFTL